MYLNEVLNQLYARKSVRVYTDREITDEDREQILTAAFMAPTAGNQQLYTIIDVQDPAIRQRLSDTCDHQPFIAEAKLVLIFCADCQKWYDAFVSGGCLPRKPGIGDLMLAVTDAAIAAQNAVAAAESLGIGSCYIGDIMENCETHRELLKLPEYVFPAAMLVFGYPTQQQEERAKPQRAQRQYLVHTDAYQKMGGEQLRGMLEYKSGALPYEEWLSRFCERKYNSDFSKEMTRSVAEYVKAFQNGG